MNPILVLTLVVSISTLAIAVVLGGISFQLGRIATALEKKGESS